MFYAVIMAGGQGTRLWPMSRKKLPKQLQNLTGSRSLIQETYRRISDLTPPERIIISTTPEYEAEIKKQLPLIPEENYIIEPFANGNAAACGLVSMILQKRDPEAAAIFLPADHAIKNEARFLETLKYAGFLVQKYPEQIVTVGIKPERPDTGLGYIQTGQKIDSKNTLFALKAVRFVEKPDKKTAENYVFSGEYLWNSGMFTWKTKHFLDLTAKNMPKNYEVLEKITAKLNTPQYSKTLNELYGQCENTSIDYGIIEKTADIVVIPGDFGWSDIGNWGAIYELISEMEKSGTVSKGHHIGHEDENCLVFAKDKLVATVGLKDIVVVDTDDAILITNRQNSHKIKDLLVKLKEEGKEEYL